MYGSITAVLGIHDACPAADAPSACPQHQLPVQLRQSLPDAALGYAAATARQSACKEELIASAASGEGGSSAGRRHDGLGTHVSQKQSSAYPDIVVYDLLAVAPQLLQPFMERLTAFASGKTQEHAVERNASSPLLLDESMEERLLVSLLIGQKMIQHEPLRAVLIYEADRSTVLGIAGLCEAVGAAGGFSSQTVAAAKQKLLSLHEIYFGAARNVLCSGLGLR